MVQVVASVNGQDSLALAYQYIVPNQPILSFRIGCLAKGLPPVEFVGIDAYDADGNPAIEQITLTADYPAFASGTQMVKMLTVSPGASVQLFGTGPFKATPSADPTLFVKESFPTNLPISDCPDPTAKYNYQTITYFPGPDPVESVVAQPLIDRRGQSVVWSNKAAPEQAAAYVALTGADRATISAARKVAVRTLGSRELTSLNRERPFGFARERKGPSRVRLLGPNFSIGAVGSRSSTAWRTPALMSFLLPFGADASQYAILRTGLAGGSWTEIASNVVRANYRTFVHANVSDSGTYALARIESPRR
jgi:hypothetical protein